MPPYRVFRPLPPNRINDARCRCYQRYSSEYQIVGHGRAALVRCAKHDHDRAYCLPHTHEDPIVDPVH